MNPQPEALRLAAQLEDPVNAKLYLAPYIAAELRRLNAANQDLLEALWGMVTSFHAVEHMEEHMQQSAARARAAIAKATGDRA